MTTKMLLLYLVIDIEQCCKTFFAWNWWTKPAA